MYNRRIFMDQKNFKNVPQIVSPSEPHMALLFLLDTSGSMDGKPINELNAALNRFKKSVCQDEKTKRILDVSIIEFNSEWNLVQDFVPVEFMKTVNLKADGSTYMAEALTEAINKVNERSKFYKASGTQPYKPWIVLISDGAPFDDVDALAKQINEMVEKQKLAFWSLAVPGADTNVLHKLSGKRVLNLADYDFKGFFDWVNKSMRAVSTSAPGEKVKGQELPDTITIDIDELM